jgi:hypothetical protein
MCAAFALVVSPLFAYAPGIATLAAAAFVMVGREARGADFGRSPETAGSRFAREGEPAAAVTGARHK